MADAQKLKEAQDAEAVRRLSDFLNIHVASYFGNRTFYENETLGECLASVLIDLTPDPVMDYLKEKWN